MYEEQDALYQLLPAYLRSRDNAGEGPLKELLTIINYQAHLIEQDIAQRMYDDWFIETCQDWVVAYIGDLLGYERMPTPKQDSRTLSDRRLAKILSPRREIGNLIAYRRRKGTLWVLEELARDVANWPARAVEFYRLLARTEHLDHPQPQRLATVDIRDAGKLELAGTPFDTLCHTIDVRGISNKYSPGRYNIPNVGLFVFRTKRYSVTKTSAYACEDVGRHCFTFSILGNDAPLFRLPVPELETTGLAEETHFAVPIRRRALEAHVENKIYVNDSLYGENKSLVIYAANWPKKGDGINKGEPMPIEAQKVISADLSHWAYQVPKNHVAIDPILGRIQFPKGQAPRNGVLVSYGYGFLTDIGGGEYDRPALPLPAEMNYFRVDPDLDKEFPKQGLFRTIDTAYQYWRTTLPEDEKNKEDKLKIRRPALLIELVKSGVYKGRIELELKASEFVCVAASNSTRPIIWLSDENANGPDSISIRGEKGSRVIFDGILIVGRGVEIIGNEWSSDEMRSSDGDLCEVVFRHSTLVPGWSLHCDCEPRRASEPSILIENTRSRIRVESSIVGAIHVNTDPALFEPTQVIVCDSIIDATSDESIAIGGSNADMAYAELRIARSTIVGEVLSHSIALAENSLFTAKLQVARKQMGCIRYSYVPVGSRTPRRYRCQPESNEMAQSEVLRLAPYFESTRYGTSNYLRLSHCTAQEIKHGADDESEMGVYHDLFEPQRLALLTSRLEEFVPASTDSAVIFAS
ncbi:hypothetical protein [Methylobacter marinus]|uniref:hypothetical protein n=1 Tax=Methylobacter marinus TaxID=34058 RepID=UPI00035D6FB0|nr:hypothetical protein [Methylobacter marinus]